MDKLPLNIADIRRKLAGTSGREYWKGLEEIAERPEFTDYLHDEFPRLAALWDRQIDRRTVLKMMAGSVAFATAGLAGCSRPIGEIVPYVNMPEGEIPGEPMYYATSFTLGGYARGVIAESYTGRPTFVEGNKKHPASFGAIDPWAQAAVPQLYDPDRSTVETWRGVPTSWPRFLNEMQVNAKRMAKDGGAGFAVLTQAITSPSLLAEFERLQKKFPNMRRYEYEPVDRSGVLNGTKMAFGERVNPVYRFAEAEVVVSLDADFLGMMPGWLAYSNDFMKTRKQRIKPDYKPHMSRLYTLASTPTITSANSDNFMPIPAANVELAARGLAARLGVEGIEQRGGQEVTSSGDDDSSAPFGGAATKGGSAEGAGGFFEEWLDAAAEDLQRHNGKALVVPGDYQPPAVHALAHAMNARLGAIGKTVTYTEPPGADDAGTLPELMKAIEDNRVETLLVLEGNPVFDAPADLDFAGHYDRVPTRIHWGLYENETAYASYWHVPALHELERWGDSRAYDGTVSLTQPLIGPIFNGRSAYTVLRVVAGEPETSDYAMLNGYWKQHYRAYAREGESYDLFWRRAVQRGLIEHSAPPPRKVKLRRDLASRLPLSAGFSGRTRGLYIQFLPDDALWDGRFANSTWLQELPRRMTKLTWDNVILLAPSTAERLGVATEDVVELEYRGARVSGPVWVLPGQPANTATVQLGYGSTRAGHIGGDVGFNVYPLRRSDSMWFGYGLKISKLGRSYDLATTQYHQTMRGRGQLRNTTFDEYRDNKYFVRDYPGQPPKLHESLYPEPSDKPPLEYRWAMTIDITACTGCMSCVIACQGENNIQSVGKNEVLAGHEMHWLRVDRYYEGKDLDSPRTWFQPVPCMQCENAPCEYVCPVEASVHSKGLNAQVYNRCIGTRDCSQNCPYKVRRFNWFSYQRGSEPVYEAPGNNPGSTTHVRSQGYSNPPASANPDVTVRQRGVMEKCTYCIQRINEHQIEADNDGRRIRDGEVQTACQRACPTNAIVFGDLETKDSEVSEWKRNPLNYEMLAELNTRPRTSYLGGLVNPNKKLRKKE
ncbi:MAG TPA: TAT-variant-translocated molybdopterin oxidoreductase [Gammaproteobacteria bacterium]|nr:TAT-variant-translocated molybdopterin oxidoreductase [Gammaproteobacteria bacterium]